jgi:hypothetical protein
MLLEFGTLLVKSSALSETGSRLGRSAPKTCFAELRYLVNNVFSTLVTKSSKRGLRPQTPVQKT